jgi:hypothetical protein
MKKISFIFIVILFFFLVSCSTSRKQPNTYTLTSSGNFGKQIKFFNNNDFASFYEITQDEKKDSLLGMNCFFGVRQNGNSMLTYSIRVDGQVVKLRQITKESPDEDIIIYYDRDIKKYNPRKSIMVNVRADKVDTSTNRPSMWCDLIPIYMEPTIPLHKVIPAYKIRMDTISNIITPP